MKLQIILSVCVAMSLPAYGFGATVVTTNSSAGAFPVSNNDLLEGLVGVVTGTALGGQEGTSSNPAVLTNGTFGPAGLPDATALAETVSIANGTTITYSLNTVAFPAGYEITSINTYSGWRDAGRDNQNYQVFVSLVDDATFSLLETVAFAPNPAPSGEVLITDNMGPLAIGVDAIQFVFNNQENGYVGFREFDVLGAGIAVVPEPTSVALWAILGCLGTGCAVCRRRFARR